MEVKITSGKYKDHIVKIFTKGTDSYFRDDELSADIPLKNYEYEDISEFICPSCNTQWEDLLAKLTCPCLEDCTCGEDE